MTTLGRLAKRHRAILAVAMCLALVGLVLLQRARSATRAAICVRYAELTAAHAAGDVDAARALVAPANRDGFDYGHQRRLRDFASPLGPSTRILIFGNFATVWPKPNWYAFKVIPIGDTVDMTCVDGVWYFTGEVHLD